MKCSLCGYVFREEEAQSGCKSCPMMQGCKLIKCPNCGIDSPPEPKWAKHLRREGE
ncbi:MAG: hypothetical protein Q7K98_07105 [Candidatus Omnitrophota bacterium]|nr:hypothetical protein [Candidatus Omnitrophota bacterium]